MKEGISFFTAYSICRWGSFDALSVILAVHSSTTFSKIITAMVVAGGSKGAIKLMQEFLGVKDITPEEQK